MSIKTGRALKRSESLFRLVFHFTEPKKSNFHFLIVIEVQLYLEKETQSSSPNYSLNAMGKIIAETAAS